MRHTILIATLSSVAASVLTTVVVSASLFGADSASSANTLAEAEGAINPSGVESILQGDVDCSKNVTPVDSLKVLRHDAGLSVQQYEPCPDIGTLAAIPGPPGPAGPQGEAGPVGINGWEVVLVDTETDSTPWKDAIAHCPAGKVILGGGAGHSGPLEDVAVGISEPFQAIEGEYRAWKAVAAEFNPTTVDWDLRVWAICANVAE